MFPIAPYHSKSSLEETSEYVIFPLVSTSFFGGFLNLNFSETNKSNFFLKRSFTLTFVYLPRPLVIKKSVYETALKKASV